MPFSLLAIAPLLLLTAQAATGPLSLKQALELAEGRAPALKGASADFKSAEADAVIARAKVLPKLSVTSSHGFLKTTNPDSGPFSSSASIKLSETLYDNGASWAGLRSANLGADAAKADLAKAREKLALDLLNEYSALTLARLGESIAQDKHKLLEKQFSTVEAQFRQGLKTRQDYLRLKGQLLRSDLSLTSARTLIQKAELDLRERMGVSPAEPLELASLPVKEGTPEAPGSVPDVEKGPAFQSLDIQREVAAVKQRQSARAPWPSVTVEGAITYGSSSYWETGRSWGANAGWSASALLGVSWTLWDFGGTWAEARTAQAVRDAREATLDAELLSLRNQAQALAVDIARLRKSHELNVELMEMERLSFEQLEDNYRRGRVSYLDLITGIRDLSEAREQYYASYFSLIKAAARHRATEGALYAWILSGN